MRRSSGRSHHSAPSRPTDRSPWASVRSGRASVVVLALLVLLAAVWGLLWVRSSPPDRLVVYCAHDATFAEAILRDFERQTGIPVAIRFDTEATKSLGLTQLLIREQNHPRCDVFWNNELLGTMDLAQQGLLLPYKGPGYARIPEQYKDPDGHWTGFAARLRVWIYNIERLPTDRLNDDLPEPLSRAILKGDLEQLAQADDLSQMAIARPLYGTTLTQYSLLWHLWGPERLKAWHHATRARGLKEVAGNAAVKNLVADGTCLLGWTDTDDFFVAQDEGWLVGRYPLRVKNGAGICIPNTVAILRGTQRLDAAQRLVEFLLSAETELALEHSESRQIPLGPLSPEEETELSRQIHSIRPSARYGYDLRKLYPARQACLEWLQAGAPP